MYKFGDNQLSLTDFGQAAGLKLNPENRWIKRALDIPWDDIEERYAKLFTNKKGNVANRLDWRSVRVLSVPIMVIPTRKHLPPAGRAPAGVYSSINSISTAMRYSSR